MNIVLRPAAEFDSEAIFRWGNDPLILARSSAKQSISAVKHSKWFSNSMALLISVGSFSGDPARWGGRCIANTLRKRGSAGQYDIGPAYRSKLPDTAAAPAIDQGAARLRQRCGKVARVENIRAMAYKVPSSYL
jgi:hypothetical protein